MQKICCLLVGFFLFVLSSITYATSANDATNTATGPAAGMVMQRQGFTLTSNTAGVATLNLPNYGALDHVSIRIPATNPVTTAFHVELFDDISATKHDLFETNGINLTLVNKELKAYANGNALVLPLTGGGYQLYVSNMGSVTTLTVILWIWE